MDGRAFVSLLCMCLITWVDQIAGGQQRDHPSSGSVTSSGGNAEINTTPKPEGSSAERSSRVFKSRPPRLATNAELKKYTILVQESIKKSNIKYDGKDSSNLKVDELLSANIKRAALPSPFITSVRSFDVKLKGHFLSDKDDKVICRVRFEWLAIPWKIQRVVTPPVNFLCSKEDSEHLFTTPVPAGVGAHSTVHPTVSSKVSGRNSNPSKVLPKSERPRKDAKKTENHLNEVKKVEINVSSQKPPLPKSEANKEEIIRTNPQTKPKDVANRGEIIRKHPKTNDIYEHPKDSKVSSKKPPSIKAKKTKKK